MGPHGAAWLTNIMLGVPCTPSESLETLGSHPKRATLEKDDLGPHVSLCANRRRPLAMGGTHRNTPHSHYKAKSLPKKLLD